MQSGEINVQLTLPQISTVAPSPRNLSTINIGVVPGTTIVHGTLSFLAEYAAASPALPPVMLSQG